MREREAQELFEAGNFPGVIALLQAGGHTARESALLGSALLHSGQLPQAEAHLHRAAVLGDEEGAVEYGNLLRLLGRPEEACAHFEATELLLREPALRLRALRWWGLSELAAGRREAGLRRVERAWHGHVALGDDEGAVQLALRLAQLHAELGHDGRARLLLHETAQGLPRRPDPALRVRALLGLLDLHLDQGELEGAARTLGMAKSALEGLVLPALELPVLRRAAELAQRSGDTLAHARALEQLLPLAERLADHESRLWGIARLAEHHSRLGLHGQAAATLQGVGLPEAAWPPELWAADGLLRARRGDELGALASLDVAARAWQRGGETLPFVRARLRQAASALRLRRHAEAGVLLREALLALSRLRQFAALGPELAEWADLLHFAVLEPELAPLVEPLLDRFARLGGAPRLPEDGAMRLHVRTLGRVAVVRDHAELRFGELATPLLLAYLALRPGQTRAEIQQELFPGRDLQGGADLLRRCLWDLRATLGPEVLAFEGPHGAPRYRLGRLVQLDLDFSQLLQAAGQGELARAVSLYRGEFLPGVEAGEWLRERRDEARLALTSALRAQMRLQRQQGDFRRVVLLANQLLRADPHDLDALHARLAAARLCASAPEVARYSVDLARALG